MKYVCEFEGEKGFGNTPLEAFNDLETNASEYINPEACTFYKTVLVKVDIKQEITITDVSK